MAKAKTKAEIRKEAGKNPVFGYLQKLGQQFMLPISILPVAGILLGVGSSFTNPAVIEMYNLQGILNDGTFLYGVLSILADAGDIIFSHLGLLFGISVAFGMAKSEQGTAALSAIIGYFVMYATLTSTINNFRDVEALSEIQGLITPYLGFDQTMNLGVLGGILLGIIVSILHNKYYQIDLPEALSFFGGTHFIPIVSSLAAIVMGIVMAFVWPLISAAFSSLGGLIAGMGIFGIFLYAYIYRALIPLGLHHVFYLPFWQTAIGGTAVVNGETVVGAQNIVFAQLAAGVPIDAHAAAHFAYMFPVMLFGIPAACTALYRKAHPERKDDAKGFYISSGLTSFMTGITEPIEFAFVFASPGLYYGLHCVMYGISAVLVYLFGAGVGLTFSGGVIDFILYGILPGNPITSWIPVLLLGLVYAVLYYLLFTWGVDKFDWKVPGREEAVDEEAVFSDASYDDLTEKEQRAYRIVSGLGGTDNLDTLSNCATRLRVTVKDGELVDEALLKSTGSAATVVNGSNVQVVYGPSVGNVKTSVDGLINEGKAPKHGLDKSEAAEIQADEAETTTDAQNSDDVSDDSQLVEIYAPARGQVIPLSAVNDAVFSEGLMGEGFAVHPEGHEVVSPLAGEVMMVMDSKHALGIRTEEGLEILVHMGIDTVELNGEGFDVKVSQGDKIAVGDPIADMDIDFIQKKGKATDIVVVVTNTGDVVDKVMIEGGQDANLGDKIGDIAVK